FCPRSPRTAARRGRSTVAPESPRAMIAFACPHCGASLQVKDSLAGTTGPCPKCSHTVQAPAAAGLSSASRAGAQQTLRPPASAEETSSDELELAPPAEYPFLASPKGADELGRLGPYRVLKVLGTGAMGVV